MPKYLENKQIYSLEGININIQKPGGRILTIV